MPRSVVTEGGKAKAVVDGVANECSHCHCGVAIINIPWLAKYVLSDFALHDFYDTHGPRTDREK